MDILKTTIPILSYALIATFLMAYLAQWHWFFALLTHFTIQYCVVALIFLPFLIFLNHDVFLSICMIAIAASSFVQTRLLMAEPWTFSPSLKTENGQTLKVAQYNKYHKNQPFDALRDWVQENEIDLLIMQEVGRDETQPLKQRLLPLLPFTTAPNIRLPGYAVIFSKYEIENLKIKHVCKPLCGTGAMRFEITLPQEQKVTVFSVHADTPIFDRHYIKQHEELTQTARWIGEDKTKNTIFLGDINTTPYSPNFKKMLTLSGLQYQNYGILPESTWPSFTSLPFLKIPIDHILFSQTISLSAIKKDKAHGSDHHSIIATFALE